MNTVLQFLKDCRTFFLATADGDQPRVRPFGAVCDYDGRLYIMTSNQKPVFQQLTANPKFEISASAGGEWIRITGEAVQDSRRETLTAMLEANPSLSQMYSADDGIMEVFYLDKATAKILSFAGRNETISF
ncbi:pyridoxamine 5'-phosphate oxidase family protein [Breznakiella homolactica]|uniref:Pyridoxamine 5'-phosphate oxidase family protein n=1 Tax=Breznakiella homolactica TaxID=2798577 RepID=A0A7T8B8Z1_9SPIR|nr:pyridoxamine 5'-phosphate oxidase family protein [Breznakiella homolactica]QQO07806.1 pyridoxamine 5'-phosphate oxidase family protein [Breznakiella homolactica]